MRKDLTAVLTSALVIFLAGSLSADETVYRHTFSTAVEIPAAYGTWEVIDGRLHQSDAENHLAKINVPAPQSGAMQYEFDLRYEDGGFDDRMGGFGVHIFVDEPHHGKSWGNGASYLLWLNYDEDATYGSPGFRAQVYKSSSHAKMELVGEYDLNRFAKWLSPRYVDLVIKGRIKVNADTGVVWVEDPTLPGWGYQFSLGPNALSEGSWVSFRTNSLALSFDNIAVTKLQ